LAVTAGAGRHPPPDARIKQPRRQARALTAAPRHPALARPQASDPGPWACSGNTGDPPRRPGGAVPGKPARNPPSARPLTETCVELGYVPGISAPHNASRYHYSTCACDIRWNGARIRTRPCPPIGPQWTQKSPPGPQQLSRKSSSTRTPNWRASTGTRSSTPWNMPAKSRSGGSRSGAKPKHRIPIAAKDLASVPPERQ
jgi:hypothetical protein